MLLEKKDQPPVEVEITGVDSSGLAVAYIQGEMPDPLPLQHQMRQPALLEAVAHDQASLAAADHEGRYLFIRHDAGPCDAWRVLPPRE